MSKKKAFKNATEEIQYIGAMLTATTQADTKRIDAAIKRLREINHTEVKVHEIHHTGVLVCRVTHECGMWTARCEGMKANSRVSDTHSLRRMGQKVFGHDNTQAYEVKTKGNVTTWLLREKPDQKAKAKKGVTAA